VKLIVIILLRVIIFGMIYFVGNYTQSFYSHNNNTKNLIIYLMSIKYFEITIYAYY